MKETKHNWPLPRSPLLTLQEMELKALPLGGPGLLASLQRIQYGNKQLGSAETFQDQS